MRARKENIRNLVTLVAVAIGAVLVFLALRFLAVDECLDWGGRTISNGFACDFGGGDVKSWAILVSPVFYITSIFVPLVFSRAAYHLLARAGTRKTPEGR